MSGREKLSLSFRPAAVAAAIAADETTIGVKTRAVARRGTSRLISNATISRSASTATSGIPSQIA